MSYCDPDVVLCEYKQCHSVTTQKAFEGEEVFSLRPNTEEHVTDCYSKFTHVSPVCHQQVLSLMIG